MNREALKQTIRVLEEVRDKEFDFNLASFVGYNNEDGDNRAVQLTMEGYRSSIPSVRDWLDAMDDPLTPKSLLIPHNCGCTACAIGYVGLDPWFRSQGFKTVSDGAVVLHTVDDGVKVGWPALEKFYDLSGDQCDYLFMPSFYPELKNPQLVINRINEVLLHGFPEDIISEEKYSDYSEE